MTVPTLDGDDGRFARAGLLVLRPPAKELRLRARGAKRRLSGHNGASEGEAMFRHACAMGLEGIVSKRVTTPLQVGLVRRLGEGQEPGI